MAEAIGNGAVIEGDHTVMVEQEHCVRPETGAPGVSSSERRPWKGTGSHWDPDVAGKQNAAPAWYPEPRPAAIRIKVHIEVFASSRNPPVL
jgi:uncharacterized protein (DUF427 family)